MVDSYCRKFWGLEPEEPERHGAWETSTALEPRQQPGQRAGAHRVAFVFF